MFELSIEREFCAAHAIVIRGEREPVHGHNFRVTVTVAGSQLDGDGLLVDFHALERVVDEVIAPYRDRDLNAIAPFDRAGGVNPTAEQVARHIGEAVGRRVRDLAGVAGLAAVRLTEAPGCSVTYRP